MANQSITTKLTLILVAVSCGLLGVSMWLMGGHKAVDIVSAFYGLQRVLSSNTADQIAGSAFIVAALVSVLALFKSHWCHRLSLLLLVIALVPLFALASNAMWISSLGGFPAIGSGQGVIKYFALLAIGLTLWNPLALSAKQKLWLNVFPVVLVLVWIGGMKFTLIEAQAIQPLVASSPLMSWMYKLWDLQTTSNLIGIYDLIAAAFLIYAAYSRKMIGYALVLPAAVFIVTQTFLLSWDAALSGKTILTTGGHFLIKDLWFIANLLFIYQLAPTGSR